MKARCWECPGCGERRDLWAAESAREEALDFARHAKGCAAYRAWRAGLGAQPQPALFVLDPAAQPPRFDRAAAHALYVAGRRPGIHLVEARQSRTPAHPAPGGDLMTAPAQPAHPGPAQPAQGAPAQGGPAAAARAAWARTVRRPATRAVLGSVAALCALGAVVLARTDGPVAWGGGGTFIGAVGGLILGTLAVDAAAPLLRNRAQRAGVRVLRSRWWFGLLVALAAGWVVATSPGDQPADPAPVSALIVAMVASGLLWLYATLAARDADRAPVEATR